MPESIESAKIFNVKSLVNDVYFGRSHVKSKGLNSLAKDQFVQTTSNDLKKLASSSDTLYVQNWRATHIGVFEWLECTENLVPHPSFPGFFKKGGVYIPRCLPSSSTFDLKESVQTSKCKKAKFT